MLRRVKLEIRKALRREFDRLERMVVEVADVRELRKLFGWDREPRLDDPTLRDFEYPEDLNMRRLRDAEVIGSVMANAGAEQALEIGTSEGRTTALMALNAPQTTIHTINIAPDELERGEGGRFTTGALERERIGAHYRERGCDNVREILANTATWEPDIGSVGVAFIDGCHDAEFVCNDTRKVLSIAEPGAFILWHDFNPGLVRSYDWIYDVCLGVEELCRTGELEARIYHLRDSWVGLYRVPT
jgi:predicted O-methyltransferase YrrM